MCRIAIERFAAATDISLVLADINVAAIEAKLAIVKNDAYEGGIFEKCYSKRKGRFKMNIRRETCNPKWVVFIGAAGEMCRIAIERFAAATDISLVLAES
jgi:hypothetical protein